MLLQPITGIGVPLDPAGAFLLLFHATLSSHILYIHFHVDHSYYTDYHVIELSRSYIHDVYSQIHYSYNIYDLYFLRQQMDSYDYA